MQRHREWPQMAILHRERAHGPRKAGAAGLRPRHRRTISRAYSSLLEAGKHTVQQRWLIIEPLVLGLEAAKSWTSSLVQLGDLEGPTTGLFQSPAHSTMKHW